MVSEVANEINPSLLNMLEMKAEETPNPNLD